MRPTVLPALALLVAALAVSGWAQSADPAAATSSPTGAASPETQPEFGSITGTVTDDEKKPIPGVTVNVIERRLETTTDNAGAFTFNEIDPGSYGLVANLVGFAQGAKKAEVRGGEITKADFILKPLFVSPDAYQVTLPYKTVIQVGEVFLDNRVPFLSAYCQGCDHYPRITPAPAGLMAEVTFTNGVTIPDDDVWLDFRRNWTNATGTNSQNDGTSVGSGYFNDREALVVADDGLKSLRQVDRIWYHVVSGLNPSVNRRVDSFVSLSYHAPFPEGFTALPPK